MTVKALWRPILAPSAHPWATVVVWLERYRARHQLKCLDARLLADIGLTREQAEAEASKPFWQA